MTTQKVTPEMDELYKEMVGVSPFAAEFALRSQKMVGFIANGCLAEGEALQNQLEKCRGNPNQRACIEGSGLLIPFERCYARKSTEFHSIAQKHFNTDSLVEDATKFCGVSLLSHTTEAPEHKRCIASRVMFWESLFPTSKFPPNGATNIVDRKAKKEGIDTLKALGGQQRK